MMSFVKKRWYLVLIVGLILVFVGYRQFGPRDASKAKSYLVKKVDLTETLSFSGGVDAEEKATMVFQTTGKLSFVKVTEGIIVKKGWLLAGLDTGDLKAAERAAYYKYLAADANAKYVEDTVKDHDKDESFLQKNNRVTAQTDRDTKYDSWLTAQRTLRYATLYSPIDGVIYSVTDNHQGEFITATNLFEVDIVNPATIIFTANADQTDVVKLQPGMVADITLDTYPDKPSKGTVKEIAFTPTAGETGTVYLVKLTLDTSNPDFQLRMGMTGDVSFPVRELTGVIAVPQSYVKTIKDERVVFKKVSGGSARARVTVGETLNGQTIVISGLNEGETIYDQAL
jgi:macrolide-specific efflux system membrane fusion protein